MFRIESLLSARLFIAPQALGDRIFFLSNLSGHISLYAMNHGGSVPEPLLPPHIAMQNPHLLNGYSFHVFPQLGRIVVMLDRDGDENYLPMSIPCEGGFPEPVAPEVFNGTRAYFIDADPERNLAYFLVDSRSNPMQSTWRVNLKTGETVKMDECAYGNLPLPDPENPDRALLVEGYSVGDMAVYEWRRDSAEKRVVWGKPLDQREEDESVPLLGITGAAHVKGANGVLFVSAIYEDTYGLVYLDLDHPQQVEKVQVSGVVHSGVGEMEGLERLGDNQYVVQYNIDGCTWLYEAEFDLASKKLTLTHVLCGQGEMSDGVLEHHAYDRDQDRYVLSFSTATSPTQIFTVEGSQREVVIRHTNERVLGIPDVLLSSGEDASFTSHDGRRISARMYLPAASLGFTGRRPLVYYIHGGPQGQERPDFAWFSMPLIQFLTLNGFAVFVPNVRGSTGYGLDYTKQVDHDWGGQDRLDHVAAMQMLKQDARVDASQAGVVGRSYGGYMTLTMAARHPDLWKAAVDMFGPFDLVTFLERIPPTWKPYFKLALGDVETDREFLLERSPRTYIDQISAPMLVIQGKNDPRVVEAESHDLVDYLRGTGKQVEYLVFENEGHDVLKYENRVRCYNAITDFFRLHLKP